METPVVNHNITHLANPVVHISPPPEPPTWLEKNILQPLEFGSMLFLKASLALLAALSFLEFIGLIS